jgi:hypothetical protein
LVFDFFTRLQSWGLGENTTYVIDSTGGLYRLLSQSRAPVIKQRREFALRVNGTGLADARRRGQRQNA